MPARRAQRQARDDGELERRIGERPAHERVDQRVRLADRDRQAEHDALADAAQRRFDAGVAVGEAGRCGRFIACNVTDPAIRSRRQRASGQAGYCFSSSAKLHLDVVADRLRVLPVALADAEVETLDRGRALEPRAAVACCSNVNSIGTSRVTLRRVSLPVAVYLRAALVGELLRDVVSRRPLLDVEQIGPFDDVVALAVARIDRRQVDRHVETAGGEILRIEADVGGEFVERAFELARRPVHRRKSVCFPSAACSTEWRRARCRR